ncbi:hypothetical protein L204_105103 [Cryptococcus depauperatus]|nr:beta-1,4-mannosyltransferase [Cryptococcus depauperatus CBS 7855]
MEEVKPYNPFKDPNVISVHIMLPVFLLIITPSTLFFFFLIKRVSSKSFKRQTATVLVLGDVGRSPRMMYHTDSLARHGWSTYLVGFQDTDPIQSLMENPRVHLLGLEKPPKFVASLPWVFRATVGAIFQTVFAFYICIWKTPYNTEILLVQNPPAIPTLVLAQFVCLVTKTKLVIDWHNTGYSLLALRVGKKSMLVKIAKWFESTFGRSAYAHIFVTSALEEYLVREWRLEGRKAVLHDRPPPHFHRTDPVNQHLLMTRLIPELDTPFPPELSLKESNCAVFTKVSDTTYLPVLKPDRPALVVSSTSWTMDEDFSLLVTALDAYQSARDSGSPLTKLIVLVTGMGSLRAPFENIVAEREGSQWKDIIVRCVFLSAKDYPTLLGCADLGVSLHSSSSGRDLPMKVVDMFGCGVPVLARNFACIDELVKEGRNGMVFNTGEELGTQMIDLLSSFPSSEKLAKLRSFFDLGAKTEKNTFSSDTEKDEWSTWEENWNKIVYNGILAKIR